MSDDFSDPANWHPIEEHPYLNDPPKVTYPPTPGGAREAVARALAEAEIAAQRFVDTDGELSTRIRSNGTAAEIGAEIALKVLRPIIAAEIRAWAEGQADESWDGGARDAYIVVSEEAERITSRICGGDQ